MNLLFNMPSIPFWEFMTPEQRWEALLPAYREFMTTKPNPPGHAEYMARAAERYPHLPRGAQQAALWALEHHGAKAAARYAANAAARWRTHGKFKFVMPKPSMAGVPKYTAKDRRELAERLERYRAHMAEGAKNLERRRRRAEKRLAREIAAAQAQTFPKFAKALAGARAS